MSKDVSAFANTYGGYLVFGVSDGTQLVGLDHDVDLFLKDTDKFMAKLNRHLEPALNKVRTKSFRFENNKIVVCYIPQSLNVTHVVKKDGTFSLPNGDKKDHSKKEPST